MAQKQLSLALHQAQERIDLLTLEREQLLVLEAQHQEEINQLSSNCTSQQEAIRVARHLRELRHLRNQQKLVREALKKRQAQKQGE